MTPEASCENTAKDGRERSEFCVLELDQLLEQPRLTLSSRSAGGFRSWRAALAGIVCTDPMCQVWVLRIIVERDLAGAPRMIGLEHPVHLAQQPHHGARAPLGIVGKLEISP